MANDESLKFNILNLVKDHREKCDKLCNVSLFLVRQLSEKAGLTFNDEEKKLFI